MDEILCFCFGYRKSDIAADIWENGHSTIVRRIVREKSMGACRCAETHPEGR